MSQSGKAPFKFSYTQPSLDWFETINVEINPDDYYYFELQRRYGPNWWLIGKNPPIENSTRREWSETALGRISCRDIASLLSGQELTVVEAKLLESRQLAALSTFFTKLKRFCLTPAYPPQWLNSGGD